MKKSSVRFILLFAITFMLNACNDKKAETIDRLYKQVMSVHDGVMPMMDEIESLKSQLNKKVTSATDSLNADSLNAESSKEIQEAISSLEDANESMMAWMRDFNSNFEEKAKEEVIDYLNDQMIRIREVDQKIKESIKRANELLNKK